MACCIASRFAIEGLVKYWRRRKLLQDARALVFTFELFQGALDVFALFYRHDNHNILRFLLFLNLFVRSEICGVRILDASSP